MTGLSPSLAKKIIEKVNSGNPPIRGVEHYTVGLDYCLETIEKEYLQTFVKEGGATFKAVIGGYGMGKTHFLFSVQNLAWKNNYATSYVTLSPIETPFHDPARVYMTIVNKLTYPPTNENEPTPGIDNFIRQWYIQKKNEIAHLEEDEQDRVLRDYADSISGFENINFTRAVRNAFISLIDDDDKKFEKVIGWIKGQEFDRRVHLTELGIYQKVDKSNAFSLIRSLSQWVSWIELSGLVILFDETEHVPSYNTRQKELLLNNLRQLIDECGSTFKNVMILYSFPDEQFLEGRYITYEALKQRLASVFNFTNPSGVKIKLDELTPEVDKFLLEMGLKLVHIYQVAYNVSFDTARINLAIKSLVEAVEKRIHGPYKRLFAKGLITVLNNMRINPTLEVNLEYAEKVISEMT
jgi:hypothetical protein